MSLEQVSARGRTFGHTDVLIHHVTCDPHTVALTARHRWQQGAASEVTGTDRHSVLGVELSTQVAERLRGTQIKEMTSDASHAPRCESPTNHRTDGD